MAAPVERLDLAAIGRLEFEQPDTERFPALRIARAALEAGGSAPTILNAANEIAVASFLEGRIGFGDIARLVEAAMGQGPSAAPSSIDEVIAIDRETRRRVSEMVGERCT
jgi:1-deoxy-D-xylulose-5-phosphate reductoisomerase